MCLPHLRVLDMLKNNPVVKKLVETGEERVGKLAQALLSNERFVTALQTLVQRSLSAKGMLDRSLRTALAAMNLPSSEDVESLRRKVTEIETMLGRIEAKLGDRLDKQA
jgi:hypothetical protein